MGVGARLAVPALLLGGAVSSVAIGGVIWAESAGRAVVEHRWDQTSRDAAAGEPPLRLPTIPEVWPLEEEDKARIAREQIQALKDRHERRQLFAAAAIASASAGASIASKPFVAPADPLAELNLDEIAQKAAVTRGEHLVMVRGGCAGCHGAELRGGVPGPDGRRTPPANPAGWSTRDWDRLLRHGVGRDGTAAWMPIAITASWSDRDISDLAAFLATVDPAPPTAPEPELGWWERVEVGAGLRVPDAARVDHTRTLPQRPPPETPDAAFGRATASTCLGCHGDPAAPLGSDDAFAALSSDLSARVAGWSANDLIHLLATGTSPRGGRPLSVHPRGFSAVEREAITAWVQGQRAR